MCANCVANVDAAAAAVGGIAGMRMWLGTHFTHTVTPHRTRIIAIAVSLALTIAPFVVGLALG